MGLIITVCLLVIALILYYNIQTRWTRLARLINKLPGPQTIPFVGNANYLACPALDWQRNFSNLVQEHGRCFRGWISCIPFVVVADGKIAEKVLSGYENVEKGDLYVAFHRVFGQGLVTAQGRKWRRDRKILNPGFGYQYFEGFLKIFNEESQTMIQIFQKTFKTGTEVHNLLPFLTRCAMDSAFQTVFGTNRGLQKNPQEEYTKRLYGLVHCTREKMLKPWLNFPIIWHLFGLGRQEDKLIDGLMDELAVFIDEKRKEKSTSNTVTGTHTKPFIAFLLEASNDDKDIAFQINTLFSGGSETTSSGLNYLMYLLALNPDCLRKVQEELETVLGDDPQRDITLKVLSELKYMEMCIKEGLRLYPPVSGWFRKLVTDVQLDNGVTLPKGCEVAILPWDIHRNPEVFPDPEHFDPERFSPENRDKIGSSGWLAFSSGPRNCIGHRYGMMQMKVVLSHVLRSFDILTSQKREDLRVIYGIVLEPVPEIRITLRPRNTPPLNTSP